MTRPEEKRREAVKQFLMRFFGPGNGAWPNLDPGFRHQNRTRPFVEALERGDDAPIVLPRVYTNRDRFVMYVVARAVSDRAKTAELIRAFAGPTYIAYDEQVGIQPVWLDPDDPVEQALRDFFGGLPIFRLETGRTPDHRRNLTDALQLMQSTEAGRPPRLWRTAKPVGRLLAEFEASLSAGAEAASRTVLEHLAATGGVTALNLANLRIKRLDRLGRSEELLGSPELADVIRQDPPVPVKEAVLNAVYASLEEPLTQGDLPTAQQRLGEQGRFVPDLLDVNAASVGAQAVTVLLLAASVRADEAALRRLVEGVQADDRSNEVPSLIWDDALRQLGPTESYPPSPADQAPSAERSDDEPAAVDSWPALLAAVASGGSTGTAALNNRSWAAWRTPAADDVVLAEFLDGLRDQAADEAWRAVGAFIDAVGYDAPAGLTAHAFIRNAVTFDRFGPGDLAVLQALTEIALRAAPSAQIYRDILEEIGAERSRWVSPERAPIALDFVDRLFLAACPDPAARGDLAYKLLEPLWQHEARLSEADLAFAKRLSQELGIAFVWQADTGADSEQTSSLSNLPSMSVLLYSLDQAVLARCAQQIAQLAPAVKVVTASDHVGSTQLRQKTRTADVIIVATRCATHAATGFIDQNKNTKHVGYANGSGSASLLRAAVDTLRAAAS